MPTIADHNIRNESPIPVPYPLIFAVSVPPKLHRIEEKITYCEDKINQLVYQLYGLTDEEIKIVERE